LLTEEEDDDDDDAFFNKLLRTWDVSHPLRYDEMLFSFLQEFVDLR